VLAEWRTLADAAAVQALMAGPFFLKRAGVLMNVSSQAISNILDRSSLQ
jgi:hypothetical protein